MQESHSPSYLLNSKFSKLSVLWIFIGCLSATATLAEVRYYSGSSSSKAVKKTVTVNQSSKQCDNYRKSLARYTSLQKQPHTSSQGSKYREKRRELRKKIRKECN